MMQKIKVLHVVTALSWRGGEQQVAYLMDELKSELDIFVLCSKESKMEQHCIENGISYRSEKKKGSLDFNYSKAVKETCEQQAIDVVHMHDSHAHTFAIIAASVFGNKTKLVLSRRVDFPISKNIFSLYKYNHHSIKKILCVSDTIKSITANGIKDRSKLSTVYSGIDLEKFKSRTGKFREELELANNAFLIGNTSALADHKDYFTFIDCAAKVIEKDANCYFVILGDGPLKKEIHEYAESKKLGDKMIFTGFRNDVAEILADLDLFLITSKTEGLGTSILDAFACKVPVVATNAGGIPELVENNKTGLLCAIKDADQLSEAVLKLKGDTVLIGKLVANASNKVLKFSKSETAKQTLTHYQSILD